MPQVSCIRHITDCREIFGLLDVRARRLQEAEENKAGLLSAAQQTNWPH